jgi:hypothetical protein
MKMIKENRVQFILKKIEESTDKNKSVRKAMGDNKLPDEFRTLRDDAVGAILVDDSISEDSVQLVHTVIKLGYVVGIMKGRKEVAEDYESRMTEISGLLDKLITASEEQKSSDSEPKGIVKTQRGAIISLKNALSFRKQKRHNKGKANDSKKGIE